MFLEDYIGHRVSTGYGYGQITDVTEDEQFVIELDDCEEIILPADAVDVMDFDEGPDDEDDDLDEDFEGDEHEARAELGEDVEEDTSD